MKEIRHKNVIIRIHGTAEREKVETATIKFLKQVNRCKRKNEEKTV